MAHFMGLGDPVSTTELPSKPGPPCVPNMRVVAATDGSCCFLEAGRRNEGGSEGGCKNLHLTMDGLKIGFWWGRGTGRPGLKGVPRVACRKIPPKAFDNLFRYPHNSTSSLLTQRRDERHSLPISVKSRRTNGVGSSFLKNQQPISVGVSGRWLMLHCVSDAVSGKEKYPDAHMKLIFPSQF